MPKEEMKGFDLCSKSDDSNHTFKFHIDADSSGGPENKPWQTFFICKKCSTVRNASEKYQLDSLEEQVKLATFIKWEVGIAAAMLVVAVLVALFGNDLLSQKTIVPDLIGDPEIIASDSDS